MCLIFLAYRCHPDYELIIAANRDEFYERPSAGASFWPSAPEVLGGRDLLGGGTWLGITKQGRYAAITNYREPGSHKPDAPTRGRLVSDYLAGRDGPGDYVEKIARGAERYNGFSVFVGKIAGTGARLFYFSNRGMGPLELSPGIHGLSNHLLDTPWPKVERGKHAMETVVAAPGNVGEEDLFGILADRSRPPDERLPRTGLSLDWERILSSPFITSPVYGTRSSTVIRVGKDGRVTFHERVFNSNPGPLEVNRFEFTLETGASDS